MYHHNEFAHRVENTKIRLDNGFQIPEVQQNNLITHQRAVKAVSSPGNESCGNGGSRGGADASPSSVEEVTRGVESVEPVAALSPSKNFDCEPSPWDNDAPTEESQEVTGGVEPVTDLSV